MSKRRDVVRTRFDNMHLFRGFYEDGYSWMDVVTSVDEFLLTPQSQNFDLNIH